MNDKIFKQYEDPWKDLPYPTYSSDFGENGCGCCACTHIAIEQESKKDWTPENLRQWMIDQGYVVPGHGTEWQGIYDTLKHIGHNTVVWVGRKDPMSMAWAELDKGNRIGVLLVDNGRTPDGTYWTSSGHYVAFNKYWKDEQGRHYFNIKDSGDRDHDGGFCYERSIKGALPQLWIVERIGSEPTPPTPTPTGKIPVNGIGDSTTVKALQRCLGLSQDGVISNQYATQQKYRPALTAVTNGKGGSKTVWKMQQWCNLSPDGYWGGNTSKGLQKKLRDLGYLAPDEPLDNICGKKTMSALQECINNDLKPKSQPTPPTPTPTPTKYTNVIDVSVHQDTINWSQVKASGIVGAMVRCGYRGYETAKLNEDKMFLNHIKGASTAGLKVGVYFFTEAINYAEGREEAEFTLKLIEKAGVNLYYPIAVDTEYIGKDDEGIIPRADNISKTARTDAIKGFCDVIKERGGQPMIYASLNWFDTHLDMSKLPFDVWVAQYYTECQYKGKYLMWQYTSKGSVEGVKGVVDMNKCYITSPAPQPQPKPTPSGGYTGSFPTEDEIKSASNQGVINRSVAWAKDIARQGFDYLMPQSAGCYFCGTTKKKAYTCMPFVTAMFAHGGGDADVLSLCKSKHAFGLHEDDPDWQKLVKKGKFAYLGRMSNIDWSAIKVGDVLVQYASDDLHGHMMLYAGNNELAEASPDIGCAITSGAKSRYARYARGESQCGEGAKNFVMRYVGTRSYMSKGDSGTAVLEWQDFLDWWSDGAFYKECGKGDGVFGANTHKWTVDFQEKEMGKGQGDGTVGMKTIAKAKEIRK